MMRHVIAGIDEAGRGPVIGPMVMACVAMEKERLTYLTRIGLRDSKVVSRTKRKYLARRIKDLARIVLVEIVEPREIDRAVEGKDYKNLNDLEAATVAKLIMRIRDHVKTFYVDSPDIKPLRYMRRILVHLERLGYDTDIELICENNADKKYAIVSAASIVAKVIRDREIEKLSKIYGDIGSGYPSDPKTLRFLREILRAGTIPSFVRRSWRTVSRLLREL